MSCASLRVANGVGGGAQARILKSNSFAAAGRMEASAKALSCSCGKIKSQEQGLSALYFGRYESRPDPVPGAVLIARPARVWLAAKTRGRLAADPRWNESGAGGVRCVALDASFCLSQQYW